MYLWFYSPLLDLGRFFILLIFYTVGRTPWTGDQPVARTLPTHRTTKTQNKRTQTSMPQVGFEPTIPVFERPKIVHALRCPYTYESGSRVRLGELDSGAGLGYTHISPHAHERTPNFARTFQYPE
jgi:hypothetical protein